MWMKRWLEKGSKTSPAGWIASVAGIAALLASNELAAPKPSDFVLLQNKLLIVNPNNKKVVDVINRTA
jgi:hypothetical protein